MNFSQTNSTGIVPSSCSHWLDVVFWIMDGTAGIVVLSGNLLTCVVFICTPYLRQNFMNIFLLSLSFADLFMGLLVVPGYAAFCEGCKYSWSEQCHFFSPLKDLGLSAVILNLLAISHDRYMAIFNPLHYYARMNTKRVGIILAGVWGIPVAIALTRVLIHLTSEKEHVYLEITINYNTSLSVFLVLLPILVLVIVNSMLTKAVKRHRCRVHVIKSDFYTENVSKILKEKEATEKNLKSRKGTISCVLVVVLFIICWLPRACLDISVSVNKGKNGSLIFSKLTMFLLIFHSSINPFIYSLYRNEFRRAAKTVLHSLIFWR